MAEPNLSPPFPFSFGFAPISTKSITHIIFSRAVKASRHCHERGVTGVFLPELPLIQVRIQVFVHRSSTFARFLVILFTCISFIDYLFSTQQAIDLSSIYIVPRFTVNTVQEKNSHYLVPSRSTVKSAFCHFYVKHRSLFSSVCLSVCLSVFLSFSTSSSSYYRDQWRRQPTKVGSKVEKDLSGVYWSPA